MTRFQHLYYVLAAAKFLLLLLLLQLDLAKVMAEMFKLGDKNKDEVPQ